MPIRVQPIMVAGQDQAAFFAKEIVAAEEARFVYNNDVKVNATITAL